MYLPGLWALPPTDRDESRFAQASRQMLESGDLLIPRVQDRERLNKPPLIYWLQAASARIFGDPPNTPTNAPGNLHARIWVYRLPSVLAACTTILLTWRFGCRMFDPRAALLGAALLAVCPIVVWDAHQARADQVLLTTVVAAQFALFQTWRTGSARWAVGFWISIALGILTKGPIAPMIAALTLLALILATGRARWLWSLRPGLGLLIVAAIIGPWLYATGERVGWTRYLSIISSETLGRSAEAREGHWGPPGYHLIMFCVLFWPGSLLTGLAVTGAIARLRSARRSRPADPPADRHALSGRAASEVFLLAWALPAWIVFEVVSTKLPHYTMPLYPALALLSARAVFGAQSGHIPGVRSFGSRLGFGLWVVIGALISGAGLALLVILPLRPETALPALLVVGLALTGLWKARSAINMGRFVPASLAGIVSAIGSTALLTQFALPPHMSLSTRLASTLRDADPTADRPLAALGYHEDSLIYLTRGRLTRLNDADLPAWLTAHPDALVVFRDTDPFLSIAPPASLIADLTGFNYSVGRTERLRVFDASRSPKAPAP